MYNIIFSLDKQHFQTEYSNLLKQIPENEQNIDNTDNTDNESFHTLAIKDSQPKTRKHRYHQIYKGEPFVRDSILFN